MNHNWYRTIHKGHITGGKIPVKPKEPKLTEDQKEALKQLENDKINYAIHDHPQYI